MAKLIEWQSLLTSREEVHAQVREQQMKVDRLEQQVSECMEENRAMKEALRQQLGQAQTETLHAVRTLETSAKVRGMGDDLRLFGLLTGVQENAVAAEPLFVGEGMWERRRLFDAIRDKPNIAVVATTADGRTFGVSYTRPVTRINTRSLDPTISAFVFRPDEDVPFETFGVKDEHRATIAVTFSDGSRSGHVRVADDGVGELWIGSEVSDSYSEQLSAVFAGMSDDSLTGSSGRDRPFHCRRVVALQFKSPADF